jgi:sirohydrochlorin cobaltochelatase
VTTGIVLFAHGSRDAGWSVPFERLAQRVRSRCPTARVSTAYLELTPPTLDEAVAALVAERVTEIVVVPIFLAPGGHVRRDLPKLVETLRARHPAVAMRMLPTIGEAEPLLDAMAGWIAAEVREQ